MGICLSEKKDEVVSYKTLHKLSAFAPFSSLLTLLFICLLQSSLVEFCPLSDLSIIPAAVGESCLFLPCRASPPRFLSCVCPESKVCSGQKWKWGGFTLCFLRKHKAKSEQLPCEVSLESWFYETCLFWTQMGG